jgi:excisionase family DNA binding protein
MSGAVSLRRAAVVDPPRSSAPVRRSGPAASLPILVNIDLVADHLGVSVRHIRRLIDERRIPFVKVGKFVRFDVDEIARWVDEHRTDVLEPPSVRGSARVGGR